MTVLDGWLLYHEPLPFYVFLLSWKRVLGALVVGVYC